MSKRRNNEEETEETVFKMPPFDEQAFLKRERRNVKTTFISFLFGLLMAFITFGFWVLMSSGSFRWPLVLLLALVNTVFIKYILIRLKIDISDFTYKNWIGNYATYFFSWLIIFIVIVNPPIYDDENPNIVLSVLPDMQEFENPVLIVAKITDNTNIEKSDISFSINDEKVPSENYEFENNIFSYTFSTNVTKETTYNFTLSAKDSGGRITEKEGIFKYSDNTIYVPEPLNVLNSPGPTVGSATSIKFKVNADITRLYYTINDGDPINVTQKEGEFYITYPKYVGWPTRTENVTMKVYAEKNYSFNVVSDKLPSQMSSEEYKVFSEKVKANSFGNEIVDNQVYYFQVADTTGVGIEKSPDASLPAIGIDQVPGFEILVFLISLIVVILIFKFTKKKSDKKK